MPFAGRIWRWGLAFIQSFSTDDVWSGLVESPSVVLNLGQCIALACNVSFLRLFGSKKETVWGYPPASTCNYYWWKYHHCCVIMFSSRNSCAEFRAQLVSVRERGPEVPDLRDD